MTGWRAIRTLALGFIPGLCPRCLSHSMFRSLWELYDRCPNCDVQYAKESGAWLGALAIGYTLGAAFALVLGILEWQTHFIAELGLHPMWTIAAVSIPATAIVYRPSKGVWFALLYIYSLAGDEDDVPLAPGATGR
jgi:uncharacterized protein (DUF983 family)